MPTRAPFSDSAWPNAHTPFASAKTNGYTTRRAWVWGLGRGQVERGGAVKQLKSESQSVSVEDARETGVRVRRRTPDSELDRAQLAGALDCSSQALLVVDGFGRICVANAAAASLLGVELERLDHTYVQNHIAALDSDLSVLEQAIDGPPSMDVSLPDGRCARAMLSALPDGRGQPTHACIALEPARTPAEAGIEAVGRLVAEVAHDINNQLSAALNYVFILRRRLAADAELAPHFEELQSTAWRAATLTSGLKLLGPKRSNDVEVLNVAAMVELLLPLLRHVTTGAQIELRLNHEVPELQLSRAHLEQLLVMTTLSAVARARKHGKVVIKTEARRRSFADGNVQFARVIWELHPLQEVPGLALGRHGARAPSSLRRAMKRCQAAPGHDTRRIWLDFVPAGRSVPADQFGK
jgi:nitrogen-specific signal transduction histidine kinase